MIKHEVTIFALSCVIGLTYGVNLVSAENCNSVRQEAPKVRKDEESKVSGAAKIFGISSLALGCPVGIYAVGEILKRRFSKEGPAYDNNLENGEYTNPEESDDNKSKNSENPGKNKKDNNKKFIHILGVVFVVLLIAYISTIIFKLVRRYSLEKEMQNFGKCYVEYESFLDPFNYNLVWYYDELKGKDMFNEGELNEFKIKKGELKVQHGKYWGWDQEKNERGKDGLVEKEGKYLEQEFMIFDED